MEEGDSMLISAKIIKKPRKRRECDGYKCNGDKVMYGEQIRLYGAAETNDKPYVLYICHECAKDSPDVQKALERIRKVKV